MACLITPAVAATITTFAKNKVDPKYHLEWLNLMLWGGTIMLIVDHIISGEIIPYFPFLSAMKSPEQIPVMLKEILVTGSLMTLAIISTWAMLVFIVNTKRKRASNS